MDIQDENVSIQKNQIVEDEKQRMNNSNVCSNCGAMLSEEQSFCHKCGKRIEQSNFEPPALQFKSPVPNYTGEKYNNYFNGLNKTSNSNIFISIGGIISGIVSMIFGFVMLGSYVGLYEFSSEYGGDAYTGIQNAAAQTANNVKALAEIARLGFAFLLISIGLIAIFYFVSNLKKSLNNL